MTGKATLGNIAERSIWTAVEAFFAVVIVTTGFSVEALTVGGVAAGLAVVKNVVLPFAAKRKALREQELPL